MDSYHKKKERLYNTIENLTKKDIIVAFSGGVDSSLLLKLVSEKAKNQKVRVYAVTVQTKLHPVGDLEIAKKVAAETGTIHKILQVDELDEAGISDNPVNRCYLCKKYIFTQLVDYAKTLDITTIVEGTNADDLKVYRPGIQAIRELNVNSPLADSDFTKEDVRKMAKEYKITVADRPSTPCMATRFPYNTKLSYDAMRQIEKGEIYIRELGFYNVRIRLHKDIARIEVDKSDINRLMEQSEVVIHYLKELGFTYITIDLDGFRSGSMDYKLTDNPKD